MQLNAALSRTYVDKRDHESADEEQRYNFTLSLTSVPDGMWVSNATPRPL